MHVTFHFEPACPWTWLTSRWLLRAAAVEGFEVRWAPFSLAHLDEVNGAGEGPFSEAKRAGRKALRVVQHLADRGDHAAVAHYYDEWGTLTHRAQRTVTPELAAEAARNAGLDDAAVAACEDASLDTAIGRATEAAYEAAGPDVGSPILQWTHDGREVWIFGPLFDRVVEPECAAEVWRGVRDLAVHGWFKELKRGRTAPPDPTGS